MPSAAFQVVLPTVTRPPFWVTVPFQYWVTCCPAVNDQVSCQPLSGSPRLVTATLAPKPPFHWLETV